MKKEKGRNKNLVAIYARLSKEDYKNGEIKDSESIKNQKLLLTDYALENKWEIYDFYIDDNFSGTDNNRPNYKRLLRDAELRKIPYNIM